MPTLPHELIRASAGTGKTHELTNRYLHLLHAGERPEDILATTFTRKAAGEILCRVLSRLAQAATDDARLAELQTALGDASLTRDQCLTVLAETAGRLHRLRVGTLDSFFAQLAGAFALEFGLPPGWRIADEHEDAALRARAIDAVLDNEDPASLLTLVHALTRGETTRSLEREVRDKVRTLYSVYRESSRDAWHRVPRLPELATPELEVAIATLRELSLPAHKTWETNHVKDVDAAASGDWADFVKGGIAGKVAAGEESYARKPIDAAVAEAYQTLIEHAKAVELSQLANQTEATYQLLEKFDVQYQQLKQQARALRFDDITFQLAKRFRPGGESGVVDNPADGGHGQSVTAAADSLAFRLDGQLQHLLLDEFQDTSLAQWSVIRPFAQRISAAKSDHSFFCVGDTKQAIYGWRGGVAEIFNAVDSELNDIQHRLLDTSWRSSPHVIKAVNQIFQNLHQHTNLAHLSDAVTDWQKQFEEHKTAKTKQGLNGYVCLQAARTANDNEFDSKKEITTRFVAEQVAEWKQKAPGYQIGVLVRRNDAVRRLIYELRELGVEASEEGGSSLDDSAAVRLVLSLVQLADHPGDTVARFHIATSPLAVALSEDDGESPEIGPDDAAAGRLARRTRRRLVDDGYGPTVYTLAGQLASSCNCRELRRLEKLIGLAYQYDDSATSRPRDFFAYVEAAKVRDPIAADVRVMTVHQAKGLEFDIVVLADLEADLIGQRGDLVVGRPSPTEPIDRVCRRCAKDVQQLMPATWQRLFRDTENQDIAESLCVLYVAVTRAVHALHMIVEPSAENERSLHKTFGGLLRAALTDGSPLGSEAIGYETGNRDWFRDSVVDSPRSAATAPAEELEPLEVKLGAPAKRRARGLQRVSPSGLEGGTHVRLSDQRSDGGGDRAAAMARGTLMHAWFEQITWLDSGPPSDDQLRAVAASLPDANVAPEDVAGLLADFHAMLDRPHVAGCLRREAYQEFAPARIQVETERPIAVRDGDRLLVGNIDRLVTIYDGDRPIAADILDFKTDSIPPGDEKVVAKKVKFYRPQIVAYRSAVGSIFRLDSSQMSAKLLFVDAGIVEEL
jgi:ATP-dependent exoDNAse (exonuclease V) beta subunit